MDAAPVEKKAFPVSGQSLTIDSDNSDIVLVPADVRDVEVSRQVDGWVIIGEGPETVWKMEGGTLTLRVKCEGLVGNCDARHEIKVPRGLAVTVKDDNGNITADGFTQALKVTTDNGDVSVRNARGPLDLVTDNGTIRVEGASSTAVTARSDNGDIRLALTGAPNRLESFSDNGAVTVEVPGGVSYAVDARTDNGGLDVGVRTDRNSPRTLKAHSENGDVTVRAVN
ncbi:DUF4097 family beta strand repeat-containing protein [Streptomyces coeruleoprunus]